MLTRKLFSTSAFRVALVYLLLFCASVSLLLGYVYWSTVGHMTTRTDEAVVADLELIVEGWRRGGLTAVVRAVNLRSRQPDENIYLLMDPGGRFLAGTLNVRAFPSEAGDNWIEFEHRDHAAADAQGDSHAAGPILARARAITLPGGFRLLVGRNVRDQRDIETLITRALAWSLGLTLLLGLAGGVVMGRNMLRRIDAVNRSIGDIMAGDFSRRLPTGGILQDEILSLSANVNAMLDRIEALMRGMREVSDDIAHDLRSPLNRLRARLEIALMAESRADDPPAAERRQALQDAIGEVDELLRLFDAMLAITRLEARIPQERRERLDLSAIAREVGELYAPAAEEQNMTLTFALPAPVPIHAVRELLARALSNLMENAIRHSGGAAAGGGRIEISTRAEKDTALVAVRDWGCGIPAGERERVFERFVRLEGDASAPGGVGLGLSLVRAVARCHGGEAFIEDAAPGCRVVLRLPTAAENTADGSEDGKAKPAKGEASALTAG